MAQTPRGITTIESTQQVALSSDQNRMASEVDIAIGEAVNEVEDRFGGHVLTAGESLNDLPGETAVYSIPFGNMGLVGDTATALAGSLVQYDTQNTTGNMRVQTRYEDGGFISNRTRNSAGVWTSWSLFHTYGPDEIAPGAARREAVVSAGLARRGNVIGTGGLPAVALRFDHHLPQFRDKVLPLLQQHRLPWGQMMNANRLINGTEQMTAAELQTAAIDSGGEVWNHSWSHTDLSALPQAALPQAKREITRGLADLRTAMPRLWIDCFAPPGQANYAGAEGWDTPEKFWSTIPGRHVLAQHAIVRGYYPGVHHHLNGPDLIGGGHITIEAQTQDYVEAAVRAAINTAGGVTFMLHPVYLDQAGYMTTTALSGALAYLAAKRDAGEVEVLSPAGILVADRDRPRRSILGVVDGGTIPSGGLTFTASPRSYLSSLGVPHELGVTMSGSGTATLTVTVATPSGDVTVTRARALTATATRQVVVVTPPLDTTGITLTVTGTGATHQGVTFRPI